MRLIKPTVYAVLDPVGKCFTYGTKTRAHLSTYSSKLGNYNGTIIFEIDIMKKSSQSIQIFVKLDFFTNVLVV